MDVSQASRLLTTSKTIFIEPNSDTTKALDSVGISKKPDAKALATAQERLLTVMEDTQKAAGHGELLRARDLGEAAAKLTGELPPSELRKILADSVDGSWRFAQGPNNTIKAVEASSAIVNGDTPAMTRADIANRVASTYEQKMGMNVLTDTLSEVKSIATNQAYYGINYVEAAWEAGENGAVSGAAKEVVDAAKLAENLVPEAKVLAEVTEKAAAKALGKTALKAIPLVGAAVIFADVANAADDTYQSVKSGNYSDAAIDAARTVSKTVFGIAGQAASPTIVGAFAINGVGESADYVLQKLKSGKEAAPVNQDEPRTKTFKDAIHNTKASKGTQHAEALANNPDLNTPITAYDITKFNLTGGSNAPLNDQQKTVLGYVEGNLSNAIQQGRIDEIKLPNVVEQTAQAETTRNQGPSLGG